MLAVIVSGLAIGAVYAATALAYNVMYSTSKVLSVTTGHLCMLGGVFGAWFIAGLGLPVPAGLVGAVLVGALFGGFTEIVGVRRVLARSDEHLWLLSTLALATMLQQAVGLWWGTEPKPFPRLIPQDFSSGLLDQKYWLPILTVLVMTAGLEAFYRLTLWGKLFQATSEDAFAARARGIPTDRVRLASYLLAGALGGLAGFAAGQLTFAFFALGLTLTLNGFIALAVGGLGSNLGALLGGAGLGLLSAFATYWFGGEYQQTIAVGLLMLVLLVRPEGLLGARRVRPV
ncbi:MULTISPECIES: branched-chain amino acid ABC transporter permease [Methylobacterium]|jgi:branched-chain amino acid transport system permease protein|uniref:High-affinity branched-chain amino acid transport system permease protein LivH n=1 Tax=Methylobacterium isbiliense TaxID=315478 RepID=A0ABQ4SLJ1_9HYPH|nr:MULTISPECIES: branched-chain amino acid ABC transporter permease [Methylobacterium]MBY0296198.1 branched-chain amino acid ABC transporter permease [Methylobacterium sp.]MDN3623915.1 branched-chain amino acid ABC transporter permease [Methylobacterium isbiliense]GJE02768.1 High-affinity branched-chain amino acid transport system permease protein LivH [Methylobacterium isbiliense]